MKFDCQATFGLQQQHWKKNNDKQILNIMSTLLRRKKSFQLTITNINRQHNLSEIQLKHVSSLSYTNNKIMTRVISGSEKESERVEHVDNSDFNGNNNQYNKNVIVDLNGGPAGHTNGAHGTEAGDVIGQPFPLSKRRWVILIGLCVFGFGNGLVNESSSILSVMLQLLGIKLQNYVYLSQIFSYTPLITSWPLAWFLDKFGLKTMVYLLVFLITTRNMARFLLFSAELGGWQEYRLAYWLVLGIFQQLVLVIYYLLPLKVSENWFSESERSIAWTLLGLTPTVGSAMSQLIIPHYVHDIATVRPLAYLNVICLIITVVALLACITKSQPSKAPSDRSRDSRESLNSSMLMRVKNLLTNWNLMIQMVTLASFGSMNMAIGSVMQDIFQGAGLDQVFTGQYLASVALFSFVLQMFASSKRITHGKSSDDDDDIASLEERCKNTANRCKLNVILINCSFLLFAATLSFHHLSDDGQTTVNLFKLINRYQWVLVMAGAAIYTAVSCFASPTFKEMSATLISGTVSEATLSAATIFACCVLGNVYSVVFVGLRRMSATDSEGSLGAMIVEELNSEGHRKQMRADYSHSLLFSCVISILATCLYVATFDGQPKRTNNNNNNNNNRKSEHANGAASEHWSGRQVID